MSILWDGIKTVRWRRWVVHLLLLAFVARALVPVGYMPDFSAASKGSFKIVICSATGAKADVLGDGNRRLPDGHVKHDQPCAFAAIAVVTVPLSEASGLVAPTFQISNLIPHLAVQLPPSHAGPLLGSRGPPQVS